MGTTELVGENVLDGTFDNQKPEKECLDSMGSSELDRGTAENVLDGSFDNQKPEKELIIFDGTYDEVNNELPEDRYDNSVPEYIAETINSGENESRSVSSESGGLRTQHSVENGGIRISSPGLERMGSGENESRNGFSPLAAYLRGTGLALESFGENLVKEGERLSAVPHPLCDPVGCWRGLPMPRGNMPRENIFQSPPRQETMDPSSSDDDNQLPEEAPQSSCRYRGFRGEDVQGPPQHEMQAQKTRNSGLSKLD